MEKMEERAVVEEGNEKDEKKDMMKIYMYKC